MSVLVNVMTCATFLGALVFVALYARTAPWRSTAVGRNVMALMAVILIVSALAVSTIIFGRDWPYRDAIRALSWGSIAVVIWWRVVLLYKAQRPPKL